MKQQAGITTVHVLATTLEGTRSAVLAAKDIAAGHDGRIVVLAPVMSRNKVAAHPGDPRAIPVVATCQAIASETTADVRVLPCVCRKPDDVACTLLDRTSIVVVGGRKRRVWPTAEQRLADRLGARGYCVLFVPSP